MCGLANMAEDSRAPGLSLPLSPSSTLGVRSATDLPPQAQSGPLPHGLPLSLGVQLSDTPSVSRFLQVEWRDERIKMAGDPSDQWLFYVQPARDLHEQNMEVVRGPTRRLHFRCVRRVRQGEQLLVWYGEELAREIGIPILGPENIREDMRYACTRCNDSFLYPNTLKAHMYFRCPPGGRPLHSQASGPHGRLFPLLRLSPSQGSSPKRPGDLLGAHHVTEGETYDFVLAEGRPRSRLEGTSEASTSSGISAFRPLIRKSWSGARCRARTLRAVEGPLYTGPRGPTSPIESSSPSHPALSPGSVLHMQMGGRHARSPDALPFRNGSRRSSTSSSLARTSPPAHQEERKSRRGGNSSSKTPEVEARAERAVPDTTTEHLGALNLSVRNASTSTAFTPRGQGHDLGSAHGPSQPIQIFNHIHAPALPLGLDHPGWGMGYPYWSPVGDYPRYFYPRHVPVPTPGSGPPYMPPFHLLTPQTPHAGPLPMNSPRYAEDSPEALGGSSSPPDVAFPFPLPSDKAGEPLDLLPRSLFSIKSRQGHRCVYCGRYYSRKYGLKIHMRTHTGYKPLKCKVCHRPFGDPSNLNKHVRLHAEGDTPYRCQHCGKVLVRRRDLERHVRSRHPVSAERGDDVFVAVTDVTSSMETDDTSSPEPEGEGEIVVE